MALGKAWREAREQRARSEQEQIQLAMQLQQAFVRMQSEKAKALEMANQAAQMGDANSMMTMAQLAKSGELDPDQSTLSTINSLLGQTQHPQARVMLQRASDSVIRTIQTNKEQKAATDSIESAVKDGMIDEAAAMNYRQRSSAGGGGAQIVKEINDLRTANATASANSHENANFLEQAKARLEAAPKGSATREALIEISKYESSPSLQEREGSGAALLAAIENKVNESRDKQIAGYVAQRKDAEYAEKLKGVLEATEETFGKKKFPGMFRRFGGDKPPDQPRTSAMQGHIDKLKAEKEKRYPGSTKRKPRVAAGPDSALAEIISSASSPEDLAKKMNSSGIPKTPENLRAIQEFLSAARSGK